MLRVLNWTTFDRTDGRNSVIETLYEIAIAAPKSATAFIPWECIPADQVLNSCSDPGAVQYRVVARQALCFGLFH